MLKIAGYDVVELIHEGNRSLVYRGIRKSDGRSFILKTLAADYPTLRDIAALKHEFNILSNVDICGVIKATEWKSLVPAPVLVLEDCRSYSLQSILEQEGTLPTHRFLSVALKLSRILNELHLNCITHQNIEPNNILINLETEDIKIIDFRLSSQLDQTPSISDNGQIQNAYAYMSPEQTGRISRIVDHRSDLYSLGVVFYRMLTGQLPFQASDPMEWMHCHIAKLCSPVGDVNSAVPETISQIVSKLLSKMAEDRYQQAQGLSYDLESCLHQIENSGHCLSFPIGQHDNLGRFRSVQRLYGREKELSELLKTFTHISQGHAAFVLVYGRSGVGKSALVNEIRPSVIRQCGYFVGGKFEQIRQNRPYEFLLRSFQSLVRQILCEKETAIDKWKQQLQEGLGASSQIVVDFIPELAMIIDTPPPLPEVTPAEAKNRLYQTFQRLVRVFAQPEHPLVIFLDDLQWADVSSLELLTTLLSDSENNYVMIVGAYRDNEVGSEHPLSIALNQLRRSQVDVREIFLPSLKTVYVERLVSDTLNAPEEDIHSLSLLIFEKTLGNAFSTRMLLKTLHQDKRIAFNFNESKWQWDVDVLRAISLTDNMVELVMMRMEHLPATTRDLLPIAACIGTRFSLAILSATLKQSPSTVANLLWPALEGGLIMLLGDNYQIFATMHTDELSPAIIENIHYQFSHDRIQEFVYGLLSISARTQIHWEIGNLLLQRYASEYSVFDIVSHLNKERVLALSKAERYQLAELNWQAGRTAKAASAYTSALEYFSNGLSILPEKSWQTNYELTFSLHRDTSECEYLCGNFERAEHLFETTLEKANSIYDQTSIHIIRLILYDNQGKFIQNLQVGGKALRSLGLRWPQTTDETPSILEEEMALYRRLLQTLDIAELAERPEMESKTALLCMQLLVNMTGPAYFTDPVLATLVTLKMTTLSIEHGRSKWTSQGYTFWGAMLSAAFHDYETAYAFGQVALQVKELYNNYNEAKVLNSYVGFISPWRCHFTVGVELLRHAYQVAIEVGDIFAGYIVTHLGLHLLLMGTNLSEIEEELSQYMVYLSKRKHKVFRRQIQIYLYCISAYRSGILSKHSRNLDDFDESLCSTLFKENHYLPGLASLPVLKIIHYFLLEDYGEALRMCGDAEQHIRFVSGSPAESMFVFYHALTLASAYDLVDSDRQAQSLETIRSCSDRLRVWAKSCQENYLHQHLLVLAEVSRISGEDSSAANLYEQSILSAQDYGFTQDVAIANELAARYYLSKSEIDRARHCLKSACYAYQQWGAVAKVASLENRYRTVLAVSTSLSDSVENGLNQSQTSTLLSSSSSTLGGSLDLSTAVKASQAIASEIRLDDLLRKLMRIMIENAGAQSGILVSKKDGAAEQERQWIVEAVGQSNGNVTICHSQESVIEEVLPFSMMNYAIRTQMPLILNDGNISDGFLKDSYIIEHHPKSLLCIPIVHQGQIIGVLYLENNFTTGAFKPERLELLNLLSAQIAVSLTNAKFYQEMQDLNQALEDSNHSLEKRVRSRTEELTQTLEVLKATQSELIIENALLKRGDEPSEYDYQVGGSLGTDAPTYVVRQADRQLYKQLRNRQYCYIFNARQMGKSSLRVQMTKRMRSEGVACVSIDLSIIGNRQTTCEQWYAGFMYILSCDLALTDKVDVQRWWQDNILLSPIHRLNEFVRQVVFTHIEQDILIFVDEVDSVMGLSFDVDDFFVWIRSCFNQRSESHQFRRLTFVLLGVATPSQLIQSPHSTPFNIGRAVALTGFQLHEAHPLLRGLSHNVAQPQRVLSQVIYWTGGQPFLTQKICQMIREEAHFISENESVERIDCLVQSRILDNWEVNDDPEHFKTIRDRIVSTSKSTQSMLNVYQHILSSTSVTADNSPAQIELLLSGLVKREGNSLVVANRLYAKIFDKDWVTRLMKIY